MPNGNQDAGKHLVRSQENYIDLNRSFAANHFRTEKTKQPILDAGFKLSDFFTKKIFLWLYHYLKSRFGPNHAYSVYDGGADNGIYALTDHNGNESSPVVIAVVGDWATFTPESEEIAEKIREHQPDYSIHIGDTYYVGAPHEVENNFTLPGSPWPRGKSGSFALLGNHEMYARGIAYFDELLGTLGLRGNDGVYQGQKAAFYCLENKYWRILGLDTGYHSIGKIPLLEMISWFAPKCRFDDLMIKWLKETLKLDDPNDQRALVVLTHHQYISAFKDEKEYLDPAEQLGAILGTNRPIIWIWGHEHKFSIYGKAQVGKGVSAYGRCIGHGGMPVELEKFEKNASSHGYGSLVMVDDRAVPGQGDYPLGYNGYCLMKIAGTKLVLEYYDKNKLLFSEEWMANGMGGMEGKIFPPDSSSALKTQDGKNWEDAVK